MEGEGEMKDTLCDTKCAMLNVGMTYRFTVSLKYICLDVCDRVP